MERLRPSVDVFEDPPAETAPEMFNESIPGYGTNSTPSRSRDADGSPAADTAAIDSGGA